MKLRLDQTDHFIQHSTMSKLFIGYVSFHDPSIMTIVKLNSHVVALHGTPTTPLFVQSLKSLARLKKL